MFTGDIGETLQAAAANQLDTVRMRLFVPLGFMLATPVETAEEILPEGSGRFTWKKSTTAFARRCTKPRKA